MGFKDFLFYLKITFIIVTCAYPVQEWPNGFLIPKEICKIILGVIKIFVMNGKNIENTQLKKI